MQDSSRLEFFHSFIHTNTHTGPRDLHSIIKIRVQKFIKIRWNLNPLDFSSIPLFLLLLQCTKRDDPVSSLKSRDSSLRLFQINYIIREIMGFTIIIITNFAKIQFRLEKYNISATRYSLRHSAFSSFQYRF